jgi:hypothetical protein
MSNDSLRESTVLSKTKLPSLAIMATQNPTKTSGSVHGSNPNQGHDVRPSETLGSPRGTHTPVFTIPRGPGEIEPSVFQGSVLPILRQSLGVVN